MEALGGLVLGGDDWKRVAAAVGGVASPCYQCGLCSAVCPWSLVQEDPPIVRRLVRHAQVGAADLDDDLWLCSTCQLCEEKCPRGVNITDVILTLRGLAWRNGHLPEGLSQVLWSVYWDGNPWGRPPSQRTGWAKGLEVPEFSADQHEVLYYVGCTPSYDRRAQKVARALVGILEHAGVRFGVLGEREPCCGDAVHSYGHEAYLNDLIADNARLFEEVRARTVITTSPHCFDLFASHYPSYSGEFRPLHYTQYLHQLLLQGKLSFPNPLSLRVTYHDPCYLGRGHKAYEEPREILRAIPGLELAEMEQNRDSALCCGGGGGRMWLETKASEQFSNIRLQQAAETEAEVLATACPYCIACFEDSTKMAGAPQMRVLDVAEIAHMALYPAGRPEARELVGVRSAS